MAKTQYYFVSAFNSMPISQKVASVICCGHFYRRDVYCGRHFIFYSREEMPSLDVVNKILFKYHFKLCSCGFTHRVAYNFCPECGKPNGDLV